MAVEIEGDDDVAVSETLLYRADARPGFEQMRGVGVAEVVETNPARGAGAQQTPELSGCEVRNQACPFLSVKTKILSAGPPAALFVSVLSSSLYLSAGFLPGRCGDASAVVGTPYRELNKPLE